MRYIEIKIDNQDEILQELDEIIKHHKNHRTRNRAMAIKMNIEHKVSIPKLSKYFNVKKRAIYDWFNNFEEYGVRGLIEKEGRGRKRILKDKKK